MIKGQWDRCTTVGELRSAISDLAADLPITVYFDAECASGDLMGFRVENGRLVLNIDS